MRRPPGVLLGFSSESSIPSTPRAGLWVRTLKLPEKAEAALRGPQVRKWAGRAHRGSVSAATEPGLRDGTGWVCFAGAWEERNTTGAQRWMECATGHLGIQPSLSRGWGSTGSGELRGLSFSRFAVGTAALPRALGLAAAPVHLRAAVSPGTPRLLGSKEDPDANLSLKGLVCETAGPPKTVS